MKITFDETDESIVFRVAGVSSELQHTLRDCYYTERDGFFLKEFPRDTPGIEQAMRNFPGLGKEMFRQLALASEIPWEKALHTFANRAAEHNIGWWLTGSCALAIRGIEISPHDVDIMLDSKDLAAIRQTFADCIVEPILEADDWVTRYFGVAFLHARIDLAFDPEAAVDDPEPVDFGPYAMNHLEEVEWQGHRIPIPPVELQLRVNKKRGRMARVRAIEEYLATTNDQ